MNQRPESSAITRATHPDVYYLQDRRLEMVLFALATGNVQRGNQSKAKRSDFPKLPSWAAGQEAQTIGSAPLPYDEMAEWLGGDFLQL